MFLSHIKFVSIGNGGRLGNGRNDQLNSSQIISETGRFVLFASTSTDLVPNTPGPLGLNDRNFFVRDLQTGQTTLANTFSLLQTGLAITVALAPDGSRIAFPNTAIDVLVGTPGTGFAGVANAGSGLLLESSLAALSRNGQKVAVAVDRIDSFGGTRGGDEMVIVDLAANSVTRPGTPTGETSTFGPASLSGNGSAMAYTGYFSTSAGAETNGYQVVLYGAGGGARIISRAANGETGNATSREAEVSADGRFVAYRSEATNLTSGDRNGDDDVFLYSAASGSTRLVSVDQAGRQLDGDSYGPQISGNGQFVLFSHSGNPDVTKNGLWLFNAATGKSVQLQGSWNGVTRTGDSFDAGLNVSAYSYDISADGRVITAHVTDGDLQPGGAADRPGTFALSNPFLKPAPFLAAYKAGNAQANTLNGSGRDDYIEGRGGADTLNGRGGNDDLFGGAGRDRIDGARGHDRMFGGGGNDVIKGGAGNDVLNGGAGRDQLTGGAGPDDFIFTRGSGRDVITDIRTTPGLAADLRDTIWLDDRLWTGNLSSSEVIQRFGTTINGDFALRFAGGETILFRGVDTFNDLFNGATIELF